MKVLYGPLVHEGQSAKAIIGPLVCEPKPINELSQVNLENLIETKYAAIIETFEAKNIRLEKKMIAKYAAIIETFEAKISDLEKIIAKSCVLIK